MDRRQFLASTVTASALPLAGCSRVGLGTTDLGSPETTTEIGETHLTFRNDGQRLLTFSTIHRHDYARSGGRLPLEIAAWHADDTRIDNFRVTVRAPASGREPATTVYLETPWFGDGRSLDFRHDESGRATVLSANDLGKDGEATLSMAFLLDPVSMPETLPVRVSGEFEFSETSVFGRTYRAEGRMEVELPRKREE